MKAATGDLIDALPDGHEVYENPNRQVYLRKIPKVVFTKEELADVEKGLRKHGKLEYFKIDVKKDAIIVYTPGNDPGELANAFLTPLGFSRSLPNMEKFLHYLPMMRFILVDEERRLFNVERWCFLGGIDGWIPLMGARGPLQTLVQKFAPHLGKESFFELI